MSDDRRELHVERESDAIVREYRRKPSYIAWLEAWDALSELYVSPKIIDLWLGPCPPDPEETE